MNTSSFYNNLAKILISFVLGVLVIAAVSGLVKQHAAHATDTINGNPPASTTAQSYSTTVQQGGY